MPTLGSRTIWRAFWFCPYSVRFTYLKRKNSTQFCCAQVRHWYYLRLHWVSHAHHGSQVSVYYSICSSSNTKVPFNWSGIVPSHGLYCLLLLLPYFPSWTNFWFNYPMSMSLKQKRLSLVQQVICHVLLFGNKCSMPLLSDLGLAMVGIKPVWLTP